MRRPIKWSVLSLVLGLISCGEPGDFIYGDTLDQIELNLADATSGVHPSQAVMMDPNNPFRSARSGPETKWQIESAGHPIASFYSWATWLATEPTGEHQYYTALSLRSVLQRALVPEDKREQVRVMAIEGFRAVLEHFPDAVTYDFTGTVAYPIALDAYRALVELGGDPGPWRVIEDVNGAEVLVQ